jgi:hypothetical protein
MEKLLLKDSESHSSEGQRAGVTFIIVTSVGKRHPRFCDAAGYEHPMRSSNSLSSFNDKLQCCGETGTIEKHTACLLNHRNLRNANSFFPLGVAVWPHDGTPLETYSGKS